MVAHPMMGYLDAPRDDIYPVYIEPWRSQDLEQYPDHFFLLKASVIHGGRSIDRLVREALSDDRYQLRSEKFEKGGFGSILYEERRK